MSDTIDLSNFTKIDFDTILIDKFKFNSSSYNTTYLIMKVPKILAKYKTNLE